MGFYMDENAAKQTCDKDFSCLPPASLEQNQALAEREYFVPLILISAVLIITLRKLSGCLLPCTHQIFHQMNICGETPASVTGV